MTDLQTHAELAAALVDALAHDRGPLFDALYGVEGVAAADKRALVVQMRDETKAMFEQARAQLGGATIELGDHHVEGSKLRVEVRVVGGPTLAIIVDDLFTAGGGLRTRDIIQLVEA